MSRMRTAPRPALSCPARGCWTTGARRSGWQRHRRTNVWRSSSRYWCSSACTQNPCSPGQPCDWLLFVLKWQVSPCFHYTTFSKGFANYEFSTIDEFIFKGKKYLVLCKIKLVFKTVMKHLILHLSSKIFYHQNYSYFKTVKDQFIKCTLLGQNRKFQRNSTV